MNDVRVRIGEKEYPMRWEVGPVREFEQANPSMNGAPVAWQTSAFQSAPLFALWRMALRCKAGLPHLTAEEAETMLQDFLDDGHIIEDARDLIGEAGVAGGFLTVIAPADESPKAKAEAGTTAPAK